MKKNKNVLHLNISIYLFYYFLIFLNESVKLCYSYTGRSIDHRTVRAVLCAQRWRGRLHQHLYLQCTRGHFARRVLLRRHRHAVLHRHSVRHDGVLHADKRVRRHHGHQQVPRPQRLHLLQKHPLRQRYRHLHAHELVHRDCEDRLLPRALWLHLLHSYHT